MRLWNLINDIESKGYVVYYCDTDSIITNCSLVQHDDLMKSYCWDKTGDELGSLKNECLAKTVKYNKKATDKVDIECQINLDGGDMAFDSFIALGCKYYTVKKTCYNGALIEMCKCKGYSERDKKLSYDNYVDIIQGKKTHLEQKQTQFNIPKSAMISENRKFGITVNKIPKTFKMSYSKGTVLSDGTVKPFQ